MKDINSILIPLDSQVYKTKELIELGLNNYYIAKLVENGVFTKISRGNYEYINKLKEEPKEETKGQSKIARDEFNKFTNSIFAREYDKAYYHLKKNFDTKTTHDYDNHLRLYALLLKELVEDQTLDFSFIDELEYFDSMDDSSIYYTYFINFSNALMSGDLNEAFYNLCIFRKNEKLRKGINNISTKLFYNMLIGINIKKQQVQVKDNIKKETVEYNPRTIDNRKRSVNYKNALFAFNKCFESEHYDDALKYLDTIIECAYDKFKDKFIDLKRLIECYLDMKNNQVILQKMNITYPDGNEYRKIFDMTLKNQDYLMAFKNIGKCIYFDKDDKFLLMYRSLLYKMMELQKINEKLVPNLKERKVKDIMEEQVAPSFQIDFNLLKDLIYERNYEQVKEFINLYFSQPNYEPNRTLYNIKKLLNYIDKLNADVSFLVEEEIEADERDVFKRFFEALRKNNFRESYKVVNKCDEITAKRNEEDIEFLLYGYVLEDLVQALDNYEKRVSIKSKISELNLKIDEYIFKKEFYTEEDLIAFKGALLAKQTYGVTLNINEIQLLNLIMNVLDFERYDSDVEIYFDTKKYSDALEERFKESISYGDLPVAFKTITDKEWITTTKNSKDKKYYEASKRILWYFKNKCNNQEKNISATLSESKDINLELYDHLEKIRKMIKNRDYYGAYNYYLDNKLEGISEELTLLFDYLLKALGNEQNKTNLSYLTSYKKCFQTGDYMSAKTNLMEYQKAIIDTTAARNLDYHFKRIEIEEKRINDPNYVKLENLYDLAKYYLENKEYEKCIEIIDEYIALDKELTPKGYLLRGRANEFLKQFDKAHNDYMRAVSIAPEPNIFYRLGKLAYWHGDYTDALGYFNAYEERRPNLHATNLFSLADTYSVLGDTDQSMKYKKLGQKAINQS